MPLTQELFLAIVLNILVYLLGFKLIRKVGGVKLNLPYTLSLVMFVIYYFVTPLYFYFQGRKTIWGDEENYFGVGVDISDFYGISLIYYGIANLLFICGYILFKEKQGKEKTIRSIEKKYLIKGILLSFGLCTFLVIINYLIEGINPLQVIFGDSENVLYGEGGATCYLRNFADSLIAINICAFYYKLKNRYLIPVVLISIILFLLMGFRYRIILVALGYLFSYLFNAGQRINTLKLSLIGLFFAYGLLFVTYNRHVFIKGDWEKLSANPIEFDYSTFFEQTRGMLDDITIIKYYETNPSAKHDYGITFTYFIIRAIPRALIGDKMKDSFYPFPAQLIIYDAYDVQWAWGLSNTGEAPLHLAYFVIAGGIPFLFIGSFFVGIFLSRFKYRFPVVTDRNRILHIIVACAFFQWITRGYFPGVVDHLAFMLIGYYMIIVISLGLRYYEKEQSIKLL